MYWIRKIMFKLIAIQIMLILHKTEGLQLPNDCGAEQYYDSGSLTCQYCPSNSSMVRNFDGFSCTCEEHSIPLSPTRCKPCNSTEVVSTDGMTCVPRKCQNMSGKIVCRKCPTDYISVTQNPDGSPMREVSCIKCARGFKSVNNKCVRCASCTCNKSQVVVRGACLPKNYVTGRPKNEEKLLHPQELLDIVKYEYFCTQNDNSSCQVLANLCVKSFYSADLGGACRLWLQNKNNVIKGLPLLTIPVDKNLGVVDISKKKTIPISVAVFSSDGALSMLSVDWRTPHNGDCMLPVDIQIGIYTVCESQVNVTNVLTSAMNETLSPYIYVDEQYKPLPLTIRKPSGAVVQKNLWPSDLFNRFFIVHNTLSTVSNITNTIYLKTILIRVRLEKDKKSNGSLRVHVSIEAQYATKAAYEQVVVTSLRVEHEMPNAGVVRGLEVCAGIFGTLLLLYALARWRGTVRRGGVYVSAVPLVAGCVADTLYFAVLLSTIHAWAAEAGTLGMTLPLSRIEERMIKSLVYSAVSLKALKIAWILWKQCTCDVFFLDWSQYNPPIKVTPYTEDDSWKVTVLAREWSFLQTLRRANPGYSVILTILVVQLTTHLKTGLPQSQGYKWVLYSIIWWSSYTAVLLVTWIKEYLVSSTTSLPKICNLVGHSLLVFEEDFYAHYVHGRSEDSKEVRSMAGPLSTCRVACVPQLRAVFKQLSSPGPGILGESESRHALLSRFLAAFFERALDGLNWVASERTIIERLLDVEMTSREAGTTSALLYDDDTTPSCLAMTWWNEEWNLSTFDAMLFSAVFVATDDVLLSVAITYIVYQIIKLTRRYFGNKNQCNKTGIDIGFH